MAEYIERDKVLAKVQLACRIALLDEDPAGCDVAFSDDFAVAVDDIVEIPAADVAPVVHGKWIDGADSFGAKRGQYRVCSRCNICIPCVTEVAKPYWRYCPNCGAHMKDGEECTL